jgi:hypothetical protein
MSSHPAIPCVIVISYVQPWWGTWEGRNVVEHVGQSMQKFVLQCDACATSLMTRGRLLECSDFLTDRA